MIAKQERRTSLLDPGIDLRPGDEVSFYHRGPAPIDLYESLGSCGCVIARQGENIDFSWSGQDPQEQRRMRTLVRSLPLVHVSQSGVGWTAESPPRDLVLAYIRLPAGKARSLLWGESSSLCVFGTRDDRPHVLLYVPAIGPWLEMRAERRLYPTDAPQSAFSMLVMEGGPAGDEPLSCIQLVRPAYASWSDERPGLRDWWTWSTLFFLVYYPDPSRPDWGDLGRALEGTTDAERMRDRISAMLSPPYGPAGDVEVALGVLVAPAGTRDDYARHNALELLSVNERLELSHLEAVRPEDARRMRTMLQPDVGRPLIQRVRFEVYEDIARERVTTVEVPAALLMSRSDVWLRIVSSQAAATGSAPMIVDLHGLGITKRALMMCLELMLFGCMEQENLDTWLGLKASSPADRDLFAMVCYLCYLWNVDWFHLYVLSFVLSNSSYDTFQDLMGLLSGTLPSYRARSVLEQPFVEVEPLVPYILHGLRYGLLAVEQEQETKRQRISSSLPSRRPKISMAGLIKTLPKSAQPLTEHVCLATARKLGVDLSVVSPAVWTYAMNAQDGTDDPTSRARTVLENMLRAPDYYDRLALLRERTIGRLRSVT
jgi:hypothetical protein